MQFSLKPNSKESGRLELLSILIEKYENENYPIDPPNPLEAILFRLDQLDMKKSEVAKVFGSRSRASEVLNGKRKLNAQLNIPAEVLIQEYQVS